MTKIKLSQREMEVVSCILIGEKSYKATGKLLNISPKTAETHLRRVMEKHQCAKADLKNILGHEELEKVYQSLKNGFVNDNNCKKRTSFAGVVFVISTLAVFAGWYSFSQKNTASNTNIVFENIAYLLPRENIVQKLECILKQQENIKFAILSGVGGVGKTTLARNFVKKQKARIKWEISAATEQELDHSFEKLAKYLAKITKQESNLQKLESISDIDSKREETIAFVAENLKEKSDWILLFDNVRDLETAKKYIPFEQSTWGNGSVIITTKDSRLGENIFFNCTLKVPEITPEEQYDLFTKINSNYSGNNKNNELKAFLNEIPRLPLDTAITAYYIKNTGINLNDYLKYLQESSSDFQKVQYKIAVCNTNYDKTRFGIMTSDFKEIIEENPKFKELLLFTLLVNSVDLKVNLLKQIESGEIVDNFLHELQRYSLAEVRQNVCNMHKFVHKVGFQYITRTSDKD